METSDTFDEKPKRLMSRANNSHMDAARRFSNFHFHGGGGFGKPAEIAPMKTINAIDHSLNLADKLTQSDLIISIEHCCNCDKHGPSLRLHDESKYIGCANKFLKMLAQHVFEKRLNIRVGVHRQKITSDSRIGAFEVTLYHFNRAKNIVKTDLYSKLQSNRWPAIHLLQKKLDLFIREQRIIKYYNPAVEFVGIGYDGVSPYPMGYGAWIDTPVAAADWQYQLPPSSSDEANNNTSSNTTNRPVPVLIQWVFDGREPEVFRHPVGSTVQLPATHSPNPLDVGRGFLVGEIIAHSDPTADMLDSIEVKLKYSSGSIRVSSAECVVVDAHTAHTEEEESPVVKCGYSEFPEELFVLLLLCQLRLDSDEYTMAPADCFPLCGQWFPMIDDEHPATGTASSIPGNVMLSRAGLFHQLHAAVAKVEVSLASEGILSEHNCVPHPFTGRWLDLQEAFSEDSLDWVFHHFQDVVNITLLESYVRDYYVAFLGHSLPLPEDQLVEMDSHQRKAFKSMQNLLRNHVVKSLCVKTATNLLSKKEVMRELESAPRSGIQAPGVNTTTSSNAIEDEKHQIVNIVGKYLRAMLVNLCVLVGPRNKFKLKQSFEEYLNHYEIINSDSITAEGSAIMDQGSNKGKSQLSTIIELGDDSKNNNNNSSSNSSTAANSVVLDSTHNDDNNSVSTEWPNFVPSVEAAPEDIRVSDLLVLFQTFDFREIGKMEGEDLIRLLKVTSLYQYCTDFYGDVNDDFRLLLISIDVLGLSEFSVQQLCSFVNLGFTSERELGVVWSAMRKHLDTVVVVKPSQTSYGFQELSPPTPTKDTNTESDDPPTEATGAKDKDTSIEQQEVQNRKVLMELFVTAIVKTACKLMMVRNEKLSFGWERNPKCFLEKEAFRFILTHFGLGNICTSRDMQLLITSYSIGVNNEETAAYSLTASNTVAVEPLLHRICWIDFLAWLLWTVNDSPENIVQAIMSRIRLQDSSITSPIKRSGTNVTLTLTEAEDELHALEDEIAGQQEVSFPSATRLFLVLDIPKFINYGTNLTCCYRNARCIDEDARCEVVGNFVFQPEEATVLPAGRHVLKAIFTPNDTDFYGRSLERSFDLVVRKIRPTVTWSASDLLLFPGIPITKEFFNVTCADNIEFEIRYSPEIGHKFETVGEFELLAEFFPLSPHDVNYHKVTLASKVRVVEAPPQPIKLVIHWDPLVSSMPLETPISSAQLNAKCIDEIANVEVNGTFAYSVETGAILEIGKHEISLTFTPTNMRKYGLGMEASREIVITKIEPTLDWEVLPEPVRIGDELGEEQLNAKCSNPIEGQFFYSRSAGYVYGRTGEHELTVTFIPCEPYDDSYTQATKTIKYTVLEVDPSSRQFAEIKILWLEPDSIPYGTPLSEKQLRCTALDKKSNADVVGKFEYFPDAGVVLHAGKHTLRTVFYPENTRKYGPSAERTVVIYVSKLEPRIVWIPSTPTVIVGEELTGEHLNARCIDEITGNFFYSKSFGYVFGRPGDFSISSTFIPDEPYDVDYKQISTTITLQILPPKDPPKLVLLWNSPDPISFGTDLSEEQLNARAVLIDEATGAELDEVVPGVFEYTPEISAMLDSGSHVLHVAFTPDDPWKHGKRIEKSVELIVEKMEPWIDWSIPQDEVFRVGDELSQRQLNARCVDSIEGNFFYSKSFGYVFAKAGTYEITATFLPVEPYDLNYRQVVTTVELEVSPAKESSNMIIQWDTPENINYGQPLTELQLNAKCFCEDTWEEVPGIFVYSPDFDSILPCGHQTLRVQFIASDTTLSPNELSDTTTLFVNKLEPNITWTLPPQPILVGTALTEEYLNAKWLDTDLKGEFFYSKSIGFAFSKPGEYEITATFIPSSPYDANYKQGSVSVSLTVLEVVVSHFTPDYHIEWSCSEGLEAGKPLTQNQLNARCIENATQIELEGTYKYTPDVDVVLSAGTHTLNVVFIPDDYVKYGVSLQKEIEIVVHKLVPTILWDDPDTEIFVGEELSSKQLNARIKEKIEGNFFYSRSYGYAFSQSGTFELSVTFIPSEPDDALYKQVSKSVQIDILDVTRPGNAVLLWSSPAPISCGTALSHSNLNARCVDMVAETEVEGKYSYSPDFGSILNAGQHVLRVTFTPDNVEKFGDSIQKSVEINVKKIKPTIQWFAPDEALSIKDELSDNVLNAVCAEDIEGSFLYLPSYRHVFTEAGMHTLTTIFFPAEPYDTNYSQASCSITVLVLEPEGTGLKEDAKIIWDVPDGIVQGTKLTAKQLNARCIDDVQEVLISGTYQYTPDFGEELPVGNHTLRVIFCPQDFLRFGQVFMKAVTLTVEAPPQLEAPEMTNNQKSSFSDDFREQIKKYRELNDSTDHAEETTSKPTIQVATLPPRLVSREFVFHRVVAEGSLLKRAKHGDTEVKLKINSLEMVPIEMYNFDKGVGIANFHLQSKSVVIPAEDFLGKQFIVSIRGRTTLQKKRIEFSSTAPIPLNELAAVEDGPFSVTLFAYPKLVVTDTGKVLVDKAINDASKLKLTILFHAKEATFQEPPVFAPTTTASPLTDTPLHRKASSQHVLFRGNSDNKLGVQHSPQRQGQQSHHRPDFDYGNSDGFDNDYSYDQTRQQHVPTTARSGKSSNNNNMSVSKSQRQLSPFSRGSIRPNSRNRPKSAPQRRSPSPPKNNNSGHYPVRTPLPNHSPILDREMAAIASSQVPRWPEIMQGQGTHRLAPPRPLPAQKMESFGRNDSDELFFP